MKKNNKTTILDKNEYPFGKKAFNNLYEATKKEGEEYLDALRAIKEKVENTIDLKYDENGEAIFTPLVKMIYPNNKD